MRFCMPVCELVTKIAPVVTIAKGGFDRIGFVVRFNKHEIHFDKVYTLDGSSVPRAGPGLQQQALLAAKFLALFSGFRLDILGWRGTPSFQVVHRHEVKPRWSVYAISKHSEHIACPRILTQISLPVSLSHAGYLSFISDRVHA